MNLLNRAQELDSAGDRIAAAQAYEAALKHGEGDRMAYVDLAVLYFTLLDPGESAALSLNQHFLDFAWTRANDLLKGAKERFGNDSEIAFWERYFATVVLGGDPFVDECRALAVSRESLVPFFYLWLSSNRHEFVDEVYKLYQQVASGNTVRERYIRSIVERVARKH
jgi:hypothetical protein